MLLVVVAEESAIAPKTSLASDAHDDTPTHPPPHSPASLADVPDLRDPALYLDGIPHDLFTFLRRESPVYFNPEPDDPDHEGFWALTRNQDIVQVSKNPKRFSSDSAWGGHRIFDEQRRRLSAAAPAERPEPPEKSDIKSMISMDPPEHSRYRGTILPGVKRRWGDGSWKRASAIRDGRWGAQDPRGLREL